MLFAPDSRELADVRYIPTLVCAVDVSAGIAGHNPRATCPGSVTSLGPIRHLGRHLKNLRSYRNHDLQNKNVLVSKYTMGSQNVCLL